MYLLKKNAILNSYILRGVFLTKKKTIKLKKQSLIYLRSPKHFNIGKHKILFFNNDKTLKYNLNLFINYNSFFKKNSLYNIFNIFHNINIYYKINSVKLKTKIKLKWIMW